VALPELGMRVVALMESFNKAKKQYLTGLDEMSKKTKESAKGTEGSNRIIAKSVDELIEKSKKLGKAFDKLSFDEFIKASKELQQIRFAEGGVDVSAFDKLIAKGESAGAAIKWCE
jgi:hypothetical protein